MASGFLGLNQFSNYRVAPCYPEDDLSPQAFVTNVVFNNAQTFVLADLSADDRVLDFSLVCIYVDNSSSNSVPFSIIIAGTGQRIVIKANTEGYYQVVAAARQEGAANLALQMSAPTAGAGNALVQVILLNYMVPPFVWPTV